MHASPEADHTHQIINRFQENLDTIHPSKNIYPFQKYDNSKFLTVVVGPPLQAWDWIELHWGIFETAA